MPAVQPRFSRGQRTWTPVTSPMRPAAAASRSQARCGAQRPFWLTARTRPRFAARSTSSRPVARSSTKGFCDRTCFPQGARVASGRRERPDASRCREPVITGRRASAWTSSVIRAAWSRRAARVIQIARRDGDNVQPVARIGVQMRSANSAGADERDADASVLRHRRAVGNVGRPGSASLTRLGRTSLGGRSVVRRQRASAPSGRR